MSLDAGRRLGPYEIIRAIGAGGMSARGYAERERGIKVRTRRGWAPAPV